MRLLRKRILKSITLLSCAMAVTFVANELMRKPVQLKALGLLPTNAKYADSVLIKPEDIKKLLVKFNYEPVFETSSGPAVEPALPAGFELPADVDNLGYNAAKMLIDTRWATVRYMGATAPAGKGLKGEDFEKAQRDAFASANDSTPVFTAAWTINEMMDKYFVPLMESIALLADIPGRVKVQASYFSPNFKYANGALVGRDNAYVVNLQSMYIYPSSCFDDPRAPGCKIPYTSTGHDPTVMGHELGHVIFNHIRGEKSLDGFQWFAVNEGYADYFSASFFSEPVLGRAWRYNRTDSPYLRRLIDLPSVANWEAAEDAHRFSTIFSSVMWRVRERLVATDAANGVEADRIALQSIYFLGETQKTRLGDASTAVLKSAEVLGFSHWKDIYREEFKKAEISLDVIKPVELKVDRLAERAAAENRTEGCGVVGRVSNLSQIGVQGILFVFGFCFVTLLSRRKRKVFKL